MLISTGVLHHFAVADLGRFFGSHEHGDAAAFVHVDFQRSWLAPFGAWLFHRTRMRLAISRHDGIRSAQRAHPIDVLAGAAHEGAPRFRTWISGQQVRGTPLPCVLTNLVGVDTAVADAYVAARGPHAARLEPLR